MEDQISRIVELESEFQKTLKQLRVEHAKRILKVASQLAEMITQRRYLENNWAYSLRSRYDLNTNLFIFSFEGSGKSSV
jgi:hypothetical protein